MGWLLLKKDVFSYYFILNTISNEEGGFCQNIFQFVLQTCWSLIYFICY